MESLGQINLHPVTSSRAAILALIKPCNCVPVHRHEVFVVLFYVIKLHQEMLHRIYTAVDKINHLLAR